MSGPAKRKKEKEITNSMLSGQSETGKRNATPTHFSPGCFPAGQKFSSKKLRNWAEEDCVFVWSPVESSTEGRIIQTNFHSLAASLSKARNPWVKSVSLRTNLRFVLAFSSLILCSSECPEVAQYLQLRYMFGTHSATLPLRGKTGLRHPCPCLSGSARQRWHCGCSGRGGLLRINPQRRHVAG